MKRTRFGSVAGIQTPAATPLFPGLLVDLGGKPLIQRAYERACAATLLDDVLVLTSVDPGDDELVEFLDEAEIPYRRGPTDVPARYLALAEELHPRWIVRVLAASPFVDPDWIDLEVGALRAFGADRVSIGDQGSTSSQSPQSAISVRAMHASLGDEGMEDLRDAESPRPGLPPGLIEVEVPVSFERPNLLIEGPADLEWARRIWAAVDHEGDGLFPVGRALRWLEDHPEVSEARAHGRLSAVEPALPSRTRPHGARLRRKR